jgi:mevalonate kinase
VASAHAKVILFGEHAVVHGRLAIAAALDRGATARASEAGEPSELHLAPWGRVARVGEDDDVARAYEALLAQIGRDLGIAVRARVEVEVEVPGGAGLGCSAAIGVSVARAAFELAQASEDGDAITRAAMAWERVFHGNPSGVDVAAAVRGGVLAFRKGEAPRSLSFPEPLELAVASTGEPASTKQMVEQVARQLARRPNVVERTFDGIDTLARAAEAAIAAARWYEVGRLMDLNHGLLASLLVSTEKLERACSIARGRGALGAKLTGGGGGGCAIAIAPGCGDAVVEAWRSAGLDGFVARIPATAVAIGASP